MQIVEIFVLASEINAYITKQMNTVGYCVSGQLEFDSEGQFLGQYFSVYKLYPEILSRKKSVQFPVLFT